METRALQRALARVAGVSCTGPQPMIDTVAAIAAEVPPGLVVAACSRESTVRWVFWVEYAASERESTVRALMEVLLHPGYEGPQRLYVARLAPEPTTAFTLSERKLSRTLAAVGENLGMPLIDYVVVYPGGWESAKLAYYL